MSETQKSKIYDACLTGWDLAYESIGEILEYTEDPGDVLVIGPKVAFDEFLQDLARVCFPDDDDDFPWKRETWSGGHCYHFEDNIKPEIPMSLGNEKHATAIIRTIKKSRTDETAILIRAVVFPYPYEEQLKYLPELLEKCPWLQVFILWSNDGTKANGLVERVSVGEVKELESETLDQIESEAIDWIDDGYLPRAMTVTVFAPKGRGKTKIMDWFTARATKRGETVMRFNLEDPVESVLKPALYAADADLTKVIWIKPQPIDLSNLSGIAAVKAKIIKEKATLVIFEPLNNYKGSAKSISEDDMRPIYMGLSAVAKETGCCIVIINHANKKKDVDVLEKSLGAGSGPAVARANFFIEKNPNNEAERILTDAGSNIPVGKSLVFTIEGKDFELDGVQHTNVGHAVFLRTSDVTGDELLEQVQTTKKGETNRIVEFLTDFLTGKGETPVDTVKLAARNYNADWTWDAIKQTWSRKKLGTTRTEGGGKNKKTYWSVDEPQGDLGMTTEETPSDGAPKF
jgi:hypothetical protein